MLCSDIYKVAVFCIISITVFYNHFATIFRTLMSFFTTLDTKLTTNDQMQIFQNSNPFLNCLDTIHIKLRSFVHSTKITCSIWHNLTSKYYYFKRQFTHYISNECLFISLQWSNYQLIQLLKMISNCCITLNV